MERTVEKVEFHALNAPKPIRVAAYARVSSDKDAMHHSLSAQVGYYSELIQSHAGWQYVGVYADEAKTGTKDSRDSFQKLLTDCRNEKIDIILTKSVSRFARNTVTLLETVRELKDLGIDIFFEEQNIHTSSGEGEVMLTILASFAQAESLSASENQKWRIKKNFEEGKPWRFFMLGYRQKDGHLEIVPKEAEVVRYIFDRYLSGAGVTAIMKELNENGTVTQGGYVFHKSAVERILRNYAYTGNLLLQTKYRTDYLTKKTVVNKGELPKYHATETHEAIIDIDTFEAVQSEIERRKKKYSQGKPKQTYPFTGLITCAICGNHFRRKVTATGPVWICNTYNTYVKGICPSKAIPESTLTDVTASVAEISKISLITADNGNILTYTLTDGAIVHKQWADRSRSESWTEEKRKAAGTKTRERSKHNG